jgi:hypothetical protein
VLVRAEDKLDRVHVASQQPGQDHTGGPNQQRRTQRRSPRNERPRAGGEDDVAPQDGKSAFRATRGDGQRAEVVAAFAALDVVVDDLVGVQEGTSAGYDT